MPRRSFRSVCTEPLGVLQERSKRLGQDQAAQFLSMSRSSGDAISFNLTDQFVDRHIREGRAQKAAIRCGESVCTYGNLAAEIMIGAVAIPTSTAARTVDYDYFLRESKARTLIVHSTLFAELAPALGAQHFLRHVIVVGELQPGCKHWNEWLVLNSPELDAATTSAKDVAFWLWTSGSTGRPKAAVHLHYDWICCWQKLCYRSPGYRPR
jgi:acyl-CoA synthetase (AMP-forming)/AMP-acid ligase II